MIAWLRNSPWGGSARVLRTAFLRSITLMLAAACAALPALAEEAGAEPADPPGRVGRISSLAGPVTLYDSRDDSTEDATLNWPITTGHRLSTGNRGRAEVRIGSLALRLDDDTIVDFTRIDDDAIQMVVQRGSMALRIRAREMLPEIDLLTPRERIVFDEVGRYRIDVDRADNVTAVTAQVGQARIGAGSSTFTVGSGQRGELRNAPNVAFQIVAAQADSFDDWVAARDRGDDVVHSATYAGREMTGIESLDNYGDWRTVDDYGAVWFPSNVASDWAPYRYGRWAWVAPWGWTWIDDSPWGFAPSHYGRWVLVGNVWGWYPGAYVVRPIYAPALVAWIGTPGLSIAISSGPPIGWFPLGPREVFVPGYFCSRRYVNFINVGHVTNINQITIVNPPPRFVHHRPGGVTWAPINALPRRDPIQRVIASPPNDWVKIPPVQRAPVTLAREGGRKFLRPSNDTPVAAAPPSRLVAPLVPKLAQPRDGAAQVRPQPAQPAPAPRSGDARVKRPLLQPPAQAPRTEAPRPPSGRIEKPRAPVQSPRVETLRPPERTPRVETLRPPVQAPRVETPRPPERAPRVETLRPPVQAPRVETPRPPVQTPRIEVPRPPTNERVAPPAAAPRVDPPTVRSVPQPKRDVTPGRGSAFEGRIMPPRPDATPARIAPPRFEHAPARVVPPRRESAPVQIAPQPRRESAPVRIAPPQVSVPQRAAAPERPRREHQPRVNPESPRGSKFLVRER